MEINLYPIEEMTIDDLADKNSLVMDVNEIETINGERVWHARFRDVEVKDGGLLESAYGSGATPETAIRDYARRISRCTLVYKATDKSERRQIIAPRLRARA